jgi:ribosome maturation factor RimP
LRLLFRLLFSQEECDRVAIASPQVEAVIRPVVEGMGFEYVGSEQAQQGQQQLLRVYIDKPAGIDIDDCAQVSHQLSGVLDVADPIRGDYTLEVSSPGMDRPLFSLLHYGRYAGARAKLRLHRPMDGQRNFQGELLGVDDGYIGILDDTRGEIWLDWADVERGRLQPDF